MSWGRCSSALLVLGLILSGAAYAATGISDRWDEILDSGAASDVTFGVSIDGPSPYVRNETTPIPPASNSKLFTSAVALDQLGSEATFVTRLTWHEVPGHGGSSITAVTLTGSGDPTWGAEEYGETILTRVNQIASELYDRGVRTIYGRPRLVPNDQRWSDPRYPQGWGDWARTSCDASLPQAFNLGLNCATLIIRAVNDAEWLQPFVPIHLKYAIHSGTRTKIEVQAIGPSGEPATTFLIRGTFARRGHPAYVDLPVNNVTAWIDALLGHALRKKGIRVVTTAHATKAEPEARELELKSPPLSRLLQPFMKHSLNLVGETLLREAARAALPKEDSLLEGGRQLLADFVGRLGLADTELFDGCGLSRASHVTADGMMALLMALRSRPDFEMIWSALPIAGVDGTLEHRMRGTPAEKRLRGKTGTLDGVYNLSGYVPREDADGRVVEYVPFVVLALTSPEHEQVAHDTTDRVGAELARILTDR